MKLSEALKKRQEENRKYWQDREEAALQTYVKDENEYSKQIQKIYSNMLADVQTQINAFYGRYADKEGITLAEAKKRVAKLDIEAYERKAKKYVEDKDFSKQANEEMRLYNATMKINRLELLKANIGLEMIAGHDELEKYMGEILQGRTIEELERQAGILGDTIRNNAKMANEIVNASFHNANFSNRIWLYQDLLRNDLDKLLQQGLIQGKNPRVLAKEIKKAFNTSTYNAERLMRTEMARVQTAAQEASLKANGFEMYQFNVNGGCCPICEEAADKDNGHGNGIYMLSAIQYGYNAPPLHPHCRCSISAYMSRTDYEAWVDRLKSGEKITWQEFNEQKAKAKTPSAAKAKQVTPKPQQSGPRPFTDSEKAAIEWYVSGDGQWINQYLRGRGDFGSLSETEENLLKELTKATEQTLAANIKKVYRSVDATAVFGNMSSFEWEDLQGKLIYNLNSKTSKANMLIDKTIGKTVTEKGFMSTSKEYDVIAEWGGFTGADKPLNIEFEVPANAKGADLKDFDIEGDEQREVLFARGTKYEITDISAKDGYIYVKAKIKA